MHELFSYDYHNDIRIHCEFERLSIEEVSERFLKEIKSDYGLGEDETIDAIWKDEWWGKRDYKEFINGKTPFTSFQKIIKSGYWEIDELSAFLSKDEDEQEQSLFWGYLSEPLKPEIYAAMVSADPDIARKYMYYAICDTFSEDYYRCLVYVLSHNLMDDWISEVKRLNVSITLSSGALGERLIR